MFLLYSKGLIITLLLYFTHKLTQYNSYYYVLVAIGYNQSKFTFNQ